MWLRKDRAGFFFKKKKNISTSLCRAHTSWGFLSFIHLQSLSRFDEVLFKSGASTVTLTFSTAYSFFFFSLSSGVHQYQGNVCLIRLEVKATKTNRDNRAKQMTDRRPCVVAQGNRVHITAETWITKLSPEMFTDNSHFFCCCRQKQGWLNIWCLICKWRRNDHQISI